MFKTIKWNTFARDFAIIQIGFALYGLSITLLIQSNLGTGPWIVLAVALANLTPVSIGAMINITGFLVLLIGFSLLKEPVGWGTIANILFIGLWVDIWNKIIPLLRDNFFPQLLMLVAAALVMGIATAIYIGVNAGAGPRDNLMLGVARVTGWNIRVARGSIEIIVLIVGYLLGGPVGYGTVIFALIIGPSIQWAFKLFKIETNTKINLEVLEKEAS